MHEEQDTCRICSAPAEPDQPLFYPCKCSGTIRYIHQDCLTTWLAHSKKKTCDVCKHPYSFQKVYAADMPPRLPFWLLIRRFAHQSAMAVLFAIRFVAVGLIWGALLPWATIWTWRMYFAMGDSTAWWISNRERPKGLSPIQNSSSMEAQNSTNTIIRDAPLESFFDHPAVRAISADIVAGQIIATIIVVAFVAIFLLREWISQNARPGIFDDADAPPGGQAVVPPAVPPVPHVIPLQAQVEPVPRAEPPVRELPVPAVALADAFPDPNAPRRRRRIWPAADSDEEEENHEVAEKRKHRDAKGKRVMRPFEARTESVSSSAIKRRHSWHDYPISPESGPSTPSTQQSERREFQFQSSLSQGAGESADAEYSVPEVVPDDWKLDFSSWNPLTKPDSSPQNGVDTPGASSRPQSPGKSIGRPPLSYTALFNPAEPGSPPNILPSRAITPLGSPSLATYRAPEELEAGPSNLSGYFPDTTADADHDVEDPLEEWQVYFRDPSAGPEGPTQDEPVVPADIEIAEHEPEAEVKMPGLGVWNDETEEEEFEEGDGLDDVAELDAHEDDHHDDGVDVAEVREDAAEEPQGGDAADPNDELEAGLEDDMEGALEDILAAVGLRGPIYGVLQNAALMIFVLDTTIGIGVWLPFTIGKSLALLSLDPRRLLYLLDFPIRAIRVITDPVVDTFMFFIGHAILPPLKHMAEICFRPTLRLVVSVFGEELVQKVTDLLISLRQDVVNKLVTSPSASPVVPPVSVVSYLEKLLQQDSAFMRYAEPYFAPLGEKLRVTWSHVQEHWTRLALGDGTTEKVFAISLGYVVDAILLAIYLNVLTIGSMRSAGRAVRNAVRQQLLVVKVAAFILVELVVFPLGCGIMLDICTLGLFPQGSFQARLDFLVYAPLTSAFYHWVIGTMFMYQFAVILAGFRTCLRAGALWFIKDPQDQNFHPIREILERPTLVHIKKLILSGIMYGAVVACTVGTISGVLRIFSGTIMPFRWKIREPLSVVPIDLLFLHFVLPYTLQYFKPKRFLRQTGLHVWRYLAAQLRLTSYLFGDHRPEEELSTSPWYMFWNKNAKKDFAGTFRRVPNTDNVALVKNEPATVEVHANGEPVDEKAANLMQLQNAEAEKASRSVKDDYTVVYLPPYFRYRIIAFIAGLWVVSSVVLAAFLGLPIVLGRYFFRLFVKEQVHDGYSFLVGFHLLWACWLVSKAWDRMDRHRQRRGGDKERADLTLYLIKRSLLWTAQAAYMTLFLGVVIPTLIAVVVELYILLPARNAFHSTMPLRIRVVDMWALGLLYAKIYMRLQRLRPMGPIGRGVEAIRRNGWNHLDPINATKDVIGPLTVGLAGMICLPPAILWAILQVIKAPISERLLYLHIYPYIFLLAAGTEGVHTVARLFKTWSQTVRDKEFLVEMRLQNLELSQELQLDPGDDLPVHDVVEG